MFQKIKAFSFVRNFKFATIISLVLILPGLAALILAPFGVDLFNFDIDFAGGTTMQFELYVPITQETTTTIETLVEAVCGIRPSSVTKAGDAGTQVVVKSTGLDSEQRDAVFAAVQERFELPTDDAPIKSEFVSASVGKDLKASAVKASLIAVVLILLYITVRFQFFSGLSAVIALMHDLLVMLSVYVVFQIPFNMNFIAAALTILGYSINATIIVFDAIRENRRLDSKLPFADLVDKSIRQTLTRSVNTTITTLFSIVLLLIFGVSSIRSFALAVTIGIVCGCYSSVCLSGPIWSLFESRKKSSSNIQ